MDFFAAGNLLLALAYILQLVEGGPAWSVMSVVNHILTLAAPIAYWLGAIYKDIVVYGLFVALLWLRPQGLMGKA